MAFYDPNREGARSRVFIYTLSTCAHCRAAQKLLKTLEVPYDFVDVDLLPDDQRQQCLAEMAQYNPTESFPTIIAGNLTIVGNLERDIRQAVAKMRKMNDS